MGFKLRNIVCPQADGLSNGSPSSPSFAEICIHIQGCEEISIYNMIQGCEEISIYNMIQGCEEISIYNMIQGCEEISIYNMIQAPRIRLRNVKYNFDITQYDQKNILAELNKTNEKIKFTAEEDVDEAMSFSDCLINKANENQLKPTIYKKKTC